MGDLSVPNDEFFDGFVTWSALEDALKGLQNSLPAEPTSSEPDVVERTSEVNNQADPVSRSSSSSLSS